MGSAIRALGRWGRGRGTSSKTVSGGAAPEGTALSDGTAPPGGTALSDGTVPWGGTASEGTAPGRTGSTLRGGGSGGAAARSTVGFG